MTEYLGTLDARGRVIMPYRHAKERLHLLRSLPGGQWNAMGRYWSCSTDEQDRPRLLELAGQLRLEVAPELLDETNAQRAAQQRLAELAELAGTNPYPFQRTGIVWLSGRSRALLADDMGLGKTMQTLWSLPKGGRAIVVCPASLKLNWRDECARWRPDLSPIVCSGRGSFRLPGPGEVVICNFELLPAAPRRSESSTWPYAPGETVLVVDEASYAKNARSKRSKSVRALAVRAERCWLLSGTPLVNKPLDLWGVLRAGSMEQQVFGGWGEFVRAFHGRRNRWGGWVFGQPKPEVATRLRRVMLRRRKEEVLTDLPSVRSRIVVTDRMDQQLRLALDRAWGYFERGSGDVQLGSSRSGALPAFSEMSEVRAELARSRVPDMLELIEQYEDHEEPLVVFSAHREPIEALRERDGWGTIMGAMSHTARHRVVEDFQEGRLRGIGLTIATGAYGLTLTRASHVLFVDLSWTPADNRQALDRVRRIGQQSSSVMVTILSSDHPLDQHVQRMLREKRKVIDGAVEARGEPEDGEDEQRRGRAGT